MSQVSRKWVEDSAINHTKLDPTDSSYSIAGLHNTGSMVVDGTASIGLGAYIGGDATVSGGFRVDGTAVIHALSAEVTVYDQLMIDQSDPQPAFIVNKTDAGTDYVVGVNNSGTGPTLVLNSTGSNVPGLQIVNAGTGTGATDGAVLRLDAANNLEVWNNEATQIQLATGGTQRVVVDATGSVGIGTTQPMTTLDVEGSLRLYTGTWVNEISTSTALGTSDNVLSTQNAVKSYVDGAAGSSSPWLRDSTTTVTYLRTITDKVGIGTSACTAGLDVVMVTADAARFRSGDANTGVTAGHSPRVFIQNTNTTTNNTEDVAFADSTGINAQIVCINQNHSTHQSALSFQTHTGSGSNPTEVMRLSSTGYVGIGTVPLYKLHIYEPSAEIRLMAQTGTSAQHAALTANGNTSISMYACRNTSDGSLRANTNAIYGSNHDMDFFTNSTCRMTITAGGLVGIGITNPSNPLSIVKTTLGDVASFTNGGTTPRTAYIYTNASIAAFGDVANVGAAYRGMTLDSQFGWLALATNGLNRLTILDNGNVGIGTASPSKKLEVYGDIALSNDGKIGQGHDYGTPANASNGTLELYNGATGKATLQSSTSTALLLNPSGGNVGIGTTSPLTNFEVYGNQPAIKIRDDGSVNRGLYLQQASTLVSYIYNEDNAALALGTNNIERMRITNGGNVGIGTPSPTGSSLHVYASSGIVKVESSHVSDNSTYVQFNNTAGIMYVGRERLSGGDFLGGDAYAGIIGVTDAHPMQFATSNAVRMTIDSAGRVGIGTTAPIYKLHVHEDVNGGCDILVYNRNAGNLAMSSLSLGNDVSFGTGGIGVFGSGFPSSGLIHSSGTYIWNTQSGGIALYAIAAASIYFGTNGSERMQINSLGNVGIGTSPGSRLHIKSSGLGSSPLLIEASDGSTLSTITETGSGNGVIYVNDASGSNNIILNSLSTGTSYFRGYVGIGTADATVYNAGNRQTMLALCSDNNAQLVLRSSAIVGAICYIQFTASDSSTTDGSIIYDNLNNDMMFATGGVERVRINSNGVVGIGTTLSALNATRLQMTDGAVSPLPVVHCISNSTNTTGYFINNNIGSGVIASTNSTTAAAVRAICPMIPSSGLAFSAEWSSGNVIFKVDNRGQIYSDAGTTISSPADFAEFSRVVGPLENYLVGTVVAQSETEDMKVTTALEIEHVYGIVTDRARFCGGLEGEKEDSMNLSVEELEKKHNARRIALCGHVLCKVVGKVNRGDRLTISDIPGVARSAKTQEEKMMFFAMARQSYDSETVGLIEVKL